MLHRGSNCSPARAMDGCIMHCSVISSRQSAAVSEIVKVLLSMSSLCSSAISSTGPLSSSCLSNADQFSKSFSYWHTAMRQSLKTLLHFKWNIMWSLPARRYASAGLCDSDVSIRLSVRLSHAGIVPSRAKAGSWNVHHLIAPWL